MPRRPRPASRNPPRSSASVKEKKYKNSPPEDLLVEDPSADEHEDEYEDEVEDGEEDADAPRIAQWVDEDDLDDEYNSKPEDGPSKGPTLSTLNNDLSELSMGALRRAQQALARTQNNDSEESEGFAEESGSEAPEEVPTQEKEWSLKPRTDIGKRQNKHAPMEVSSKKPVTRKRTVVEVKVPQARDPRFLAMTGEFSSEQFRKNYNFLTGSHKTELQTLRENLKRARKLLSSSPRDLRSEREAEVQRLELAVKRAESAVNRDRREEVEQKALQQVSKEEREKRKTGKGHWYLKNSAKKGLLVKARYDAIAETGGQSAVKKAIEKRRKKISQKEKKSRPFSKGAEQSGKRPSDTGDGGGIAKRRKLW